MDNMEEYLKFAKEIAYEAGNIIKKYFSGDNGAVVSNSIVHDEVVDVLKRNLTNKNQ